MKNKVKIKKFNSQTIKKDYIKNVKDFFTVFGITIAPAIIFSLAIVFNNGDFLCIIILCLKKYICIANYIYRISYLYIDE